MKKSFLVPKHKTDQKKNQTKPSWTKSRNGATEKKVALGSNALQQPREHEEFNLQKRKQDDDQHVINKKKRTTNIRMLDEQVRTNEQMLFRCLRSDESTLTVAERL